MQYQIAICKGNMVNSCVSIASGMQDPTGEAASEAQKQLVLYELDLGLNHVIRKSSEPVDNGANLLIPVPGGEDGPGGVLVCAENYLIYMKDGMPGTIQAVIPRRNTLRGDRGVLIVAWAKHQVKTMFFFLLQVRQHCTTDHLLLFCTRSCHTLSISTINMFVAATQGPHTQTGYPDSWVHFMALTRLQPCLTPCHSILPGCHCTSLHCRASMAICTR